MSAKTRICYKCGNELPPGVDKCPVCGSPAPLSDDELAETSSRVFRNSKISPIPSQHLFMPQRPASDEGSSAAIPTVPIAALGPTNQGEGGQSSAPQRPQRPEREGDARPVRKSGSGGAGSSRIVLIAAMVALLVIVAGTAIAFVFGGDDEGGNFGTFYPIEDIVLSANADGSGGAVATVPFGERVSMVSLGPDRSLVKYTRRGEDRIGYACTDMLMDSASRATLVSIVRGHALRAVPHGYQRRALIDFFLNSAADGNSRWRLEVPTMDIYREVYTDRIVNPDSRYEDLAVVLTNGMDHKLVLFTFDAAGTARVFGSRAVNGSKIHRVSVDPAEPGRLAVDVRDD